MTGKISMTYKIIEVRGSPNPNCYIIEEEREEHKNYLVHVGDIEQNEKLLYELYKEKKFTLLKVRRYRTVWALHQLRGHFNSRENEPVP
jgi:hypothetical protein